jgi:hypothetical protein
MVDACRLVSVGVDWHRLVSKKYCDGGVCGQAMMSQAFLSACSIFPGSAKAGTTNEDKQNLELQWGDP